MGAGRPGDRCEVSTAARRRVEHQVCRKRQYMQSSNKDYLVALGKCSIY